MRYKLVSEIYSVVDKQSKALELHYKSSLVKSVLERSRYEAQSDIF